MLFGVLFSMSSLTMGRSARSAAPMLRITHGARSAAAFHNTGYYPLDDGRAGSRRSRKGVTTDMVPHPLRIYMCCCCRHPGLDARARTGLSRCQQRVSNGTNNNVIIHALCLRQMKAYSRTCVLLVQLTCMKQCYNVLQDIERICC